MVTIEGQQVEARKILELIFADEQASDLEFLDKIIENYNAQVKAWKEEIAWQKHVKTVGVRDYRQGWRIFQNGGMLGDCPSPAAEAGWRASKDADPAMRKVGVRS